MRPLTELVQICDPDDLRVSAYRDIRERDLVGRRGRFVAEGKVVLRALLESSRFEAESILISENKINGLAEVLVGVSSGTPVYVAPSAILEKIAGFALHRGILAIGKRVDAAEPEVLVSQPDQPCLLVICVGISNHDNVGSIFRNAAAFGADAVLLDETCCDPLYRKALRVSVGSVLKVPFFRGRSANELMELLADRQIETYAMSPSGGVELEALNPSRRSAIMFGSEGPGLPEEILNRVQSVRIAMMEGIDSLNVGATSAIALHMFRGALTT
ncbi:MAG: TrmH family RNA methyltransferase [Rhizobiaceae bacterium]